MLGLPLALGRRRNADVSQGLSLTPTGHTSGQEDLREEIEVSEEWQVQEAKAKFSEFLDAALSRGPQVVTKRGVPTAVLVPIDEWRRLQADSKPSLKDLLLDAGARTEALVPERADHKHRAVPLSE